MAKRTNKTFEQQEKYYEVSDFVEFLLSQWVYGYKDEFVKYFKELNKKYRADFIMYLIESKPDEWKFMVSHLLYN